MSKKGAPSRWESDAERARELAFDACSGGLRIEPEELLELLFLVLAYEGPSRDALIEAIAEEAYPLGVEGSRVIAETIKAARRRAGC